MHTIEILGYATLLQLWWIAIWGIAYIFIEVYCKKSLLHELSIYIVIMLGIILLVTMKPHLMRHLTY